MFFFNKAVEEFSTAQKLVVYSNTAVSCLPPQRQNNVHTIRRKTLSLYSNLEPLFGEEQ